MRPSDALSLARTLMAAGARVVDREPRTNLCETPRCTGEAVAPARLCGKCQSLSR